MEEKFAFIKPYYKVEIAELYKISKKTLISTWINEFETLKLKLERAGYIDVQRQFTLKQVEILFEHFSQPEIPKNSNFKEQKSQQKVKIKSYSIPEISNFYYWDTRTLKNYMKIVLKPEYYTKIFSRKINNAHFIIDENKKILNSDEVFIIFNELGHPFLQ